MSLGTRCLELRSTTEWVEEEDCDALVIVVGFGRGRATNALRHLAPPVTAEASAGQRRRDLTLAPPGAGRRIGGARVGDVSARRASIFP